MSGEVKRFGRHRNAFGFLRLLFASLVIVSHVTELADGNRGRELLTRLFGTITFGELAVDGFFIISGYLIVGSYLKRPGIMRYLRNRIARIYPGFVVASIVSLVIVAPLAGGDLHQVAAYYRPEFLRMLLLQSPVAAGTFPGQHHPDINGATWTIAYEFRCYLLVLVLGSLGILRRGWVIPLLAAISLFLFEVVPSATFKQLGGLAPLSDLWLGTPDQNLRLVGMFLAGASFFLFRDMIQFKRSTFLVAIVFLAACLLVGKLSEPAVATLGGYIIFAMAAWGSSWPIGRINNEVDISYGVYLYGWPTAQLLIRFWPSMPAVMDGLITLAVAVTCGWLSWWFVERPAMGIVRRSGGWARFRPNDRLRVDCFPDPLLEPLGREHWLSSLRHRITSPLQR